MSAATATSVEQQGKNAKPAALAVDLSKMPAEVAVQRLIDHAVAMGASDLFLATNEANVSVSVRHLGIVQTIGTLSSEQGKRAMSHIKASAGMDLTERRRPSDGRWIYRRETAADGNQIVDMRINVIPTMYGEDFAIRLLTRGSKLFSLENLGMGKDQYARYCEMINAPSGLVLITGPTGSGKTGTLYATLIKLNDGRRKINTIEDPVEYSIDGLRQSQVNSAIDVGFADLLRSVLRQSPDIIMIGEIRDEETARTAVHAANSGMLVFATLHAPSSAAAVQSMRSLGAHSHFLAQSLRGVVAQRLVRTLCPHCRTSFDLSDAPHTFDEVRPWLAPDEGKSLYAARGCEACGMSGYSARTGVFEVMPVNKDLRALIADGATTAQIRDKAVEQKVMKFRQSAMMKVARGETSTEEVFRVIPSEHLLLDD
jgi:type II secretory ATPase GspE/PulE/Tfp pilus assembly ATPase PilB-like protein